MKTQKTFFTPDAGFSNESSSIGCRYWAPVARGNFFSRSKEPSYRLMRFEILAAHSKLFSIARDTLP